MSDKLRKIQVLWIDDESNDDFRNYAFKHGIHITDCKTVTAGINELQDRSKTYEAIILDANCKYESEREAPNASNLKNAINKISKLGVNLPWFVYTGGTYEGKDSLKYIIPDKDRWWGDERLYYNKPEEAIELFKAIHKAVENSEVTKIKNKYAEAFNIYSSQDLLKILQEMDTDEFATDSTVPNTIRNIAEEICFFLRNNGIFPEGFQTSNRLKECSILFSVDEKARYVPKYIQGLFRFLCDYANEGSHATDPESTSRNVNDEIRTGRAKYLNCTAVDALLNIFSWCSEFPIKDLEKMKPIQKFFIELKTEEANQMIKCPKCNLRFFKSKK